MTRARPRGIGLSLAGGGCVLLAASYVAAQFDSVSQLDAAALRAGVWGGGLLLGLGALFLLGFTGGTTQPTLARVTPAGPPAPWLNPGAVKSSWNTLNELLRTFEDWLSHAPRDASVWNSFDQFGREMLARYADVEKVRCFAVRDGEGRLRSLTRAGEHGASEAPSARDGILGHVATTGRAYDANDESLGETVHELAGGDRQRWRLVWPVSSDGKTIGIIAAGAGGETSPESTARAAAVLACLELLWRHLALRDELHTAHSTDKATGVLTREEFFATASASVEQSNRQHEPVVMTALMLEGLRGLDDKGLWDVRDALVQGVGRRLLDKLRRDDVVGRLSDDRFVFLMRRIDSALGRLIAQHIAEAVQNEIAGQREFAGRVGVRLGLAGSGLRRAELDELLASAWRSVDAARRRGEQICADTGAPNVREDRHED